MKKIHVFSGKTARSHLLYDMMGTVLEIAMNFKLKEEYILKSLE